MKKVTRNILFRGVVILGMAVLAVVLIYPLNEKLRLGVDLRGGMYLALKVRTDDATTALRNKEMSQLPKVLDGLSLSAVKLTAREAGRFALTGVPQDKSAFLQERVASLLPDWSASWQGAEVEWRLKDDVRERLRESTMERAVETIRNRVDAFGIAEPVLQRQGRDRILLQLPGADDPTRIIEGLRKTALLELRLCDYPPAGGLGAGSRQEVLNHYQGELPPAMRVLARVERDTLRSLVEKGYFSVKEPAILTGRDLKSARPGVDPFQQPVVLLTLTEEAGELLSDFTRNHVGRGLAMVLDGIVLSAPIIQERLRSEVMIHGGFTQQQAQDLAAQLSSGALPAGIDVLTVSHVGPSLGTDAIEDGLRAGLLGALLVALALLLVYTTRGLNSLVALGLNALLVLAALATFGAALTLPGIAGIILTLGMAVDANVLVFERIREEQRSGGSPGSSINAGFKKALTSVLDANLTTLIVCFLLFHFGSGPIRGFAVTLSIGVISSFFTAIFVSRWLFDLRRLNGR